MAVKVNGVLPFLLAALLAPIIEAEPPLMALWSDFKLFWGLVFIENQLGASGLDTLKGSSQLLALTSAPMLDFAICVSHFSLIMKLITMNQPHRNK